jgi:hypothetical protein
VTICTLFHFHHTSPILLPVVLQFPWFWLGLDAYLVENTILGKSKNYGSMMVIMMVKVMETDWRNSDGESMGIMIMLVAMIMMVVIKYGENGIYFLPPFTSTDMTIA